MRLVVAGEQDRVVLDLKQRLLENKICSDVQLLPIERVADQVVQHRARGVLLYLPRSPERAIQIIRDLRETTNARILVIGPAAEAKLILRILREGAFQYIDQDDVATELEEAIARFHHESPADQTLGRLITVVGAGGGSGASTVAANVAAALSKRHQQCALLDLHSVSGDLETMFDIQATHTLADFCRRVEHMDKNMFSRCLSIHACGVHLLAAPRSYRDFKAVTSRGIRKALGMARSEFDYVVADVGSPFQKPESQAIVLADTILLVMRLDFASVRQVQQLLDYFEDLGVDRTRVQVTVSRYGRPRELRLSAVERSLGVKTQYLVPDDSRRVNRSHNCGIPVVLDKPRASVSRKLFTISESVNGKK